MELPIETSDDDESCMQKFYCIGRAEHVTGDKIESTWPSGFIKHESQANTFLESKLKEGQTLKAIWVGNFNEDKYPVLKFGDKEEDGDRRVPRGLYTNWKEHWDKDRPAAATRTSRRMEARLEAARAREEERKKEEKRKKEEANNVYKLPYDYFFAPSNCEEQ